MAATQKKKQQEVPAPQVEARIDRMVDGDYKTKAYASVTIAGAFAVHGLRVIETDQGALHLHAPGVLQEKRRDGV